MNKWDRVIDNAIAGNSNTRPKLPGVSNVTDAQLNVAGWYERMYLDAPEGHTATAYQWAGVIDGRSVYGVSSSEPTPEPAPERFEAGIDTPILVLDTPDAKGIGYVAAPDGTLVPVIYAHESPYDMAALKARKAAALADYETRKTAREAVRSAAARDAAQAEAGANGAGNSVALLRAEVARVAAAVKALTEGGL